MAAEEDSIEQVVAARQERLRALKAAQELLNTPDEDSSLVDSNADEDNETSEETMKFRNYVPHDKKLQEGKLVPPVLPKFEDPVAAVPSPSEKKEDPFVNIAPKKPNWELRRDVQKKLDKLERRTQKAMFCVLVPETEDRGHWTQDPMPRTWTSGHGSSSAELGTRTRVPELRSSSLGPSFKWAKWPLLDQHLQKEQEKQKQLDEDGRNGAED
ncbi:hypothetical protein Prudu_015335 [Prunus dulcis]|uniref:Coiled-coil domain-containing protein 12 n=1 Tax=Prunus dulcis TaxID=3755 RepID=A0A4Y1RKP3_PRUDU|nr:hypothetical protein Prudu_015335 [Prunus dulcis]